MKFLGTKNINTTDKNLVRVFLDIESEVLNKIGLPVDESLGLDVLDKNNISSSIVYSLNNYKNSEELVKAIEKDKPAIIDNFDNLFKQLITTEVKFMSILHILPVLDIKYYSLGYVLFFTFRNEGETNA